MRLKKAIKCGKHLAAILTAVLALSILCVGCGSSGNTAETTEAATTEAEKTEEVTEPETTEPETTEVEELSAKEGKSSIDIAEFMAGMQEVPDVPFKLDTSQSDFITEHMNLFPADKDDLEELYSYYDPELDYAHMKKNPQRYCGDFAYLEHLQVIEAGETSLTDGEYDYFTVFNALTSDPESCFIYYIGKSVDAVEGDYISAVIMPIDNSSYEVLNGGTRTTIVMLASIIENDNSLDLLADFSSGALAQSGSDNSDSGSGNDNDYILPESDSRYYSDTELSNMSKDDLRKARNEIYARHGRIFDSADLDEYFRSKSWYEPTIAAAQFSDNLLNDFEKANARTIQAVENPPVEDMTKQLNGANFYGEYIKYDESGRRIDVVIDADGESDKITFTDPRDESIIYSGRMDYENGNVFTADGLEGRIWCIVGDSSLYVEVLNDPWDLLSVIDGSICPLIKRYDFTHTG